MTSCLLIWRMKSSKMGLFLKENMLPSRQSEEMLLLLCCCFTSAENSYDHVSLGS